MSIDTHEQVIAQFRADADRFGAVVRSGGTWSGTSPCEGWTAVDVLDHVIETQRDFAAQHGVDLGPVPSGDPAERWAAHLATLLPALTPELLARGFDGYFGPTTVASTLENFYGFDLVAHRWDLGAGLGQEVTFSDAELDRLEAALPAPGTAHHEAFYSDGVVHAPLPVTPGASRQTVVLAALGRRA